MAPTLDSPSSDVVALLDRLVRFRSDLVHGDERPLAEHLAGLLRGLGADAVAVEETPRAEGKAAAWVYARFGRPRLLVNAHLDTVPPNADWSSDPFVPRIEGNRFHALGAADTKGAAAAILSALAEARPRDVGVLFSGDEETSSVAMKAFVESPHRAGLERAIVCEPTNMQVGTRHRGYVAFDATVHGPGGHSSRADAMASPIGRVARLAVALDDWATRHKPLGPLGFEGMCLNLAKVEGGIAPNVVPAEARLVASVRPPPGADTAAVCSEIEAIAREVLPEATTTFFRRNASFATRDLASFEPLLGEAARAPIDLAFWTEAAVLAERGVDAGVVGPGASAPAHAPDEWVELAELEAARRLFVALFTSTARAR